MAKTLGSKPRKKSLVKPVLAADASRLKRAAVANTIQQQLGGNRFTAMTGAKQFVAVEGGVQFKLPSGLAKDKINTVIITLGKNDLYTLDFFNIRGSTVKKVKTSDNIHVAGLRPTFTVATGLDTHL